MLASLDMIDWADLTHAYGRATDVPDQIRALRSADPNIRDKALHSLYGSIFHQGTRFEASAYAVPFLLELVADPETPDRVAVLGLLTQLAIGYGEQLLPSGYPLDSHRATAAGGDLLLAAGKEFADDDDDEEDDEEDDWDEDVGLFDYLQTLEPEDEERLFAYFALKAYDAVGAGLPVFRGLLADENARLRAAAAYALAWYPGERSASLPPLLRAAVDEEPSVAATALVAIGLLGVPSSGTPASETVSETAVVLGAALDDYRDVVRWGAAIAQSRLRGPEAGGRVADELLGWIARDDASYEAIPFNDGDLRGYAALALRELGDAHADALFAALLARLPALSGMQALPMAVVALRIAYPEPLPVGTPFTALDDRQQRLLRVLADSWGVWELGNFLEFVSHYGLPRSRKDMAAYARA
ncbi:HEAT repeat domain-containing protein [Nonomuraea sp. NEAU-A123]|uniref:HEAT repeat domain-containing protein n=1 Tax=Nonomuraea sp. NEAU-A123 TaxID=2839649 RepID=UPI001BE46B46|nr:HEAT repeat domain-containing protein [Nonomuraea sp. NEAU-A123]MBT2232705.1 HEAT repeat domain-containing protein [Nonomuraea sp. NEAU-A123]